MYTVIYLYRVKQEHVQTFTNINSQASEIYLSNGALEDNTYRAEDLNGNYGAKGLIDVIQKEKNEEIFFGQSVFRNKSHHDDVMAQVNQNPEIKELFDDITNIINLSNVVTATFTTEQ
ncbi:Protein of unknown function [Lentibacillus halodurans]|uniref:Uncharacterized protein n=1 Tax=Lentibacillus halodurans TaxID=237679 RepID=A0A1I0YTI6_9BACI|nr:DUF1428 family protein [Lentibacillus halodurans]SFB16297.1 Protein of unknown function [Lentibacillus halodurans]